MWTLQPTENTLVDVTQSRWVYTKSFSGQTVLIYNSQQLTLRFSRLTFIWMLIGFHISWNTKAYFQCENEFFKHFFFNVKIISTNKMTLMYVIFFYTLTESVLFPYKHTMILEMYNDKIPQTTLLYFSKKKLTRNSATWDKMNS